MAGLSCENVTSTTIRCLWRLRGSVDKNNRIHCSLTCDEAGMRNKTIYDSGDLCSTVEDGASGTIRIRQHVQQGTIYNCAMKLRNSSDAVIEQMGVFNLSVYKYIPPELSLSKQEIDRIVKNFTQSVSSNSSSPTQSVPNIDRSTQIVTLLPLAAFNKSRSRIRYFSVVVSGSARLLQPEGELETGVNDTSTSANPRFASKSYEDCDRGRACNYEVRVLESASPPRQRRSVDVTASPRPGLSNTVFVVGAHRSCEGIPRFQCNGPLAPHTSYTVALRAYTHRGFLTVGEVTKETAVEDRQTSVGVFVVPIVVGLVFVIVVVGGVLLYKRSSSGSWSLKKTPRKAAKKTQSTMVGMEMNSVTVSGSGGGISSGCSEDRSYS